MNWKFWNKPVEAEQKATNAQQNSLLKPMGDSLAARPTKDQDIFKAYIPEYLYAPPYGTPRKINMPYYRKLAKNPFIFSVIKTLCDEATSIPWKIQVKKDFIDEQTDEDEHTDKINEVTRFLNNPNGNNESFEQLMRTVITDIMELDAGIIIKVFNYAGEMKQLFARDGSTFLKHPDIFGYMGDRADFVPPMNAEMASASVNFAQPQPVVKQMMKAYDSLYRPYAAYFQYGWTAGSMPVPFGKREVVYIMQNPRPNSIYGRAPLEVLDEVVQNLVYGVQMHNDFFTNNNIPEGVIQLLGASQDQITQFRDNFNKQFQYEDSIGNKRKKFYTFPIASQEVKFTPFQVMSKDMEVLKGQEWFTKLVWMCYGVNANEMGYTDQVNKATGEVQEKIAKRRALRPLLKTLAYNLNTQIIPEFFTEIGSEMTDFGDCPIEFVFDEYDFEEDKQRHDILQQEINMGVKTAEMAAKELDINVEELKASKQEQREIEMEMYGEEEEEDGEDDWFGSDSNDSKNPEEKSSRPHKYIERRGGKGHYVYVYKVAKGKKSTTSVKQKDIVELRTLFDKVSSSDLQGIASALVIKMGVPVSDRGKVEDALLDYARGETSLSELHDQMTGKKGTQSKTAEKTSLQSSEGRKRLDTEIQKRLKKRGIEKADAKDWEVIIGLLDDGATAGADAVFSNMDTVSRDDFVEFYTDNRKDEGARKELSKTFGLTIAGPDKPDKKPLPEGDNYESRVKKYENEGMTRSDAQGVVDAEDINASRKKKKDATKGMSKNEVAEMRGKSPVDDTPTRQNVNQAKRILERKHIKGEKPTPLRWKAWASRVLKKSVKKGDIVRSGDTEYSVTSVESDGTLKLTATDKNQSKVTVKPEDISNVIEKKSEAPHTGLDKDGKELIKDIDSYIDSVGQKLEEALEVENGRPAS